jgi:hypothetical protein
MSWEQARKEEVVSRPMQSGTRDRASLARDVSANDASRDADISASSAKEEMQIPQGGEALEEERNLLIKRAIVGIVAVLIVLYILLWALGMLESLWTGIISGLFLLILVVLAVFQKYRVGSTGEA